MGLAMQLVKMKFCDRNITFANGPTKFTIEIQNRQNSLFVLKRQAMF